MIRNSYPIIQESQLTPEQVVAAQRQDLVSATRARQMLLSLGRFTQEANKKPVSLLDAFRDVRIGDDTVVGAAVNSMQEALAGE